MESLKSYKHYFAHNNAAQVIEAMYRKVPHDPQLFWKRRFKFLNFVNRVKNQSVSTKKEIITFLKNKKDHAIPWLFPANCIFAMFPRSFS